MNADQMNIEMATKYLESRGYIVIKPIKTVMTVKCFGCGRIFDLSNDLVMFCPKCKEH